MVKLKVLEKEIAVWEQLNTPDFKPIEFEGFRKQAGDGKEIFGNE